MGKTYLPVSSLSEETNLFGPPTSKRPSFLEKKQNYMRLVSYREQIRSFIQQIFIKYILYSRLL